MVVAFRCHGELAREEVQELEIKVKPQIRGGAHNVDYGWGNPALSLINSWANAGGSSFNVACRIVGDRVWWHGTINGGATNTAVFSTLPASIRPSSQIVLNLANQISGGPSAGAGAALLVIDAAGGNTIGYSGASPTISFDGVSYPID